MKEVNIVGLGGATKCWRERREVEEVAGVGKEGLGRTVCLLVHAGLNAGDAVSKTGLGGA